MKRLTDETGGQYQYQDADFSVISDEFELWYRFRKYFAILRKNAVKIAAVAIAITGVMFLRDAMTAPQYTATTILLIKNNQPPLFSEGTMSPAQVDGYVSPDDQTQNELLKSRSLAARVILQDRTRRLATVRCAKATRFSSAHRAATANRRGVDV